MLIDENDPLHKLDAMANTKLNTTVDDLISDTDWDKLDEELEVEGGMARIILDMLSEGITPEEVAKSQGLGISELDTIFKNKSYIRLVKDVIVSRHHLKQETNNLIDSLEHKSLLLISTALPNMKPHEALATFKVLNSAKRHASEHTTKKDDIRLEALGEETVELEVIPQTKPVVKITSKGEIYEVNGRELETMSLNQLHKEADEFIKGKETVPSLEELNGQSKGDSDGAKNEA